MQLAKYADEFYVPPEEFNDLGEMTQSQVNKFLGDIGYAPKEDEMTKEQNSLKFIADLVKGTEFEGKVFLAGGAVRDELMGTSVKDIDLVVAMPDGGIKFANWITKLTDTYSEGSNPVTFERFGTAKFNLRGKSIGGVDISDVDIEVVMTRDEKYEPGSRKPSVVYSDLESDAYRRDLTVNSLFKDIVTGEILDFTGRGIEDITRGVVRTPLDPNETFKEDPLRMLRVVRFAVKYNWKIPRSLVGALKNNAGTLQEISKERIRDELNKILLTDSPDLGLKLMSETGLMKYVIPELDEGRGVKQNEYHKHDVYEHILEVVKNSPAELIPRLSALFHDIGKPATKSVGSDGRVHFYAHEDIGAVMAADIMKRLRYTNDEISSVQNIVQNHMSLKQTGPSGEKATDKQLRRFMARLGNDIVHALGMMHADNISHKDTASMPAQIKNIASKIENLKTTQVSEKPNLPINGNDVIQRLGISPGPMISSLLSVVADAWYENPDITKEDAIRLIKNKYSDIVRTNLARLPDKIENPVTKNRIKPATALKYDKEHPARKLVIKLLQQLLLRDK
jgi:poly(A) polymerase